MPWLVVIGERDGLRWVLEHQRMAFRSSVRARPEAGDELALYVTRGAFHNPSRDQAQVLALGAFQTPIQERPAEVMGESYPLTASLRLEDPLPERAGMPFKPLVASMSFIKKKAGWAAYLRRTLIDLPADDFEIIRTGFEAFASESRK